VIPLPTVMLDALMAGNLVLSLLILLKVLYDRKPTDFTLFPVALLVVTVFSLALNVSSTRLILTMGARFDGRMVKAFSTFVVGSSDTKGLVIGFVIFIVLIAVQAMVITKGATRISEVAARFTLDSLPGKQMAIDAEYNSGAIDQKEALLRKEALQRESDFYGSMDGASKFISGNVKVGILITAVNILGGVIIGSTLQGEDLSTAFGTYVSFSIGDGLLSQFPALFISTAMGIVVARAAATGELAEQVSVQFAQNAKVYWIAAAVLAFLAFLPIFPKYVLFPMAALLAYYAFRVGRLKKKAENFDDMMAKTAEGKKTKDDAEISHMEPLDPLSLELGFGLIPLVDKGKGAELLERVAGVRRQTALDLGVVIPKIHIIDNMLLSSSEYCFKIRGADVGRGNIRMGYYLCINPGTVTEELPGEKAIDPAFGLPALWITEDKRDEAERAGYTVVDPPSIIATHLTEIIKRHAAEILDRQATQALIDGLKKDYSAVVEELMSPGGQREANRLVLGDVQKVLQGLLQEQVSIRNMVSIMESMADYAHLAADDKFTDTRFLIEKARQALGSQICLQYADDERRLHVLTLDPGLEQKILDSRVQNRSGETVAALEPTLHKAWIAALTRSVAAVKKQGYAAVILTSEAVRHLVKTALDRELPEVAVLSVPEIAQDFTVESLGVIKLE